MTAHEVRKTDIHAATPTLNFILAVRRRICMMPCRCWIWRSSNINVPANFSSILVANA